MLKFDPAATSYISNKRPCKENLGNFVRLKAKGSNCILTGMVLRSNSTDDLISLSAANQRT